MSFEDYETYEFYLATDDLERQIPISVDVHFYTDHGSYDLKAETMGFQVNGKHYVHRSGEPMSDAIASAVALKFDEEALAHIRDTSPAFEGIPLDGGNYGMSQDKYQSMRI